MSKERLLTVLVLADFVLGVSAIAVESAMQWTLPPLLREAIPGSAVAGTVQTLATALWFVSAATFVLAWIGLLSFWRWARGLYLLAWGLAILVGALDGPSVMTAPGGVLDVVGTLVSGSLIGLVYFSDLSRRFEAPKGQPVVAAAL